MVGKAISHNGIEITGRFRDQAVYVVQYDPDEQAYEDGSLWDEVIFFFGDDQRQELEYHVRLIDDVKMIEVVITDENDVPVMEGGGLTLLQQIYSTLKTEVQKKQ
jgi:outer membrane protein assembly factor BamC